MKYLAKVGDDGLVENIIIASDEFPSDGWIEYTEANPAFIGGDLVDGYFYSPQPFPSWTRNQGQWVAPFPPPDEENWYRWNEDLRQWVSDAL